MKELVFEELTREQKIGLAFCAHLCFGEEDDEYALSLIREHKLGAVWVPDERIDFIKRIKETADYPILIMCDAENGYGEDGKIPQLISITAAGGRDEHAYSFGRVTAARLKEIGYNTVCNPLLDMKKKNSPCGENMRTLGNDKEVVTRLSARIAEGMHDAGVLTVAKHYPGAINFPYDSHMRGDGYIDATLEELIDYHLYPYIELTKRGLIDGIMVGHKLVPAVDSERIATLSRPVTKLLRDRGFDGFYVTDALSMLGIVAKYGWDKPIGMAVAAGVDLPLPWCKNTMEAYEAMRKCYNEGVFSDADLDEAVEHILDAQHKVFMMRDVAPTYSREDLDNIKAINVGCIAAVCEDGLTPDIPKNAKHLFVIMTEEACTLDFDSKELPTVTDWYYPQSIARALKNAFPTSESITVSQYPDAHQVRIALEKQTVCDDVVFITFTRSAAYTGRECLSSRIVDLMDAMQSTDGVIAHVHFGNPYAGATAPYAPRYINGYCSAECVSNTLKVLSGELIPGGVIPYANVEFHKKGHVFE